MEKKQLQGHGLYFYNCVSLKMLPKYIFIKITLLTIILSINQAYCQSGSSNEFNIDSISKCGCPKIEYVNPGSVFYNGLGSIIEPQSISDMSGWTLAGEKFENLFTADQLFSGDESDFSSRLAILSNRKAIKLTPPDKTFTLNLTPCKNTHGNYLFPVSINFTHKIVHDIRDFDFTKFDYTALSYVHLLLQLSNKRPDEMIRIALTEKSREGLKKMNSSIASINYEFKTAIPLATGTNYLNPAIINSILDSLISKKLRQEKVLANSFILSSPGTHRINDIEEENLRNLFMPYYQFDSAEDFERKYIKPNIYIQLESRQAIIEISTAIIHPVIKENGGLATTEVWADIKSAKYTSDNGLDMTFNSVCIPPSVITGTTILIDFTKARLLAARTAKNEELESLPTNFTGLFVKDARLSITTGKDTLQLKASDLIINNFLIAGYISLKRTSSYPVPLPTLVSVLKKSGLTSLKTKIIGNELLIYFKKL